MPKKEPAETPLYVRLPAAASDKLDRAAAALGLPKKDLVAGLVTRYVDPDSRAGLSALGSLAVGSRPLAVTPADERSPMVGSYSFQPYDPPEIMSAEQAAQFLQVEVETVVELAEAGTLPGRKLGAQWRFSREALVAWLAGPERR